MDNLYKVLGVLPDATQDEIKARFKYLALAYHPDRFSNPIHKAQAEDDFKRINNAFMLLSDPIKRADYDKRNTNQNEDASTRREQNQKSTKISRDYIEELIITAINAYKFAVPKVDLRNMNLSFLDLSEIKAFEKVQVNFSNSDLHKTNLSGNKFSCANFEGTNLSQAELRNAVIFFSDLTKANVRGINLSETHVLHTNLRDFDFTDGIFIGTSFFKVDLSRATVINAHLKDSRFSETILDYSNFKNCDFSNANLSQISMIGVNLQNANLSNASLSSSDLSHANLNNAKLVNANLASCNFGWADLMGCDLSGADLLFAKLENANLYRAKFNNARRLDKVDLNHQTVMPDGLKKGTVKYLRRFL
jgi:uncharacterized protein YjbI with pentapeptide repeats